MSRVNLMVIHDLLMAKKLGKDKLDELLGLLFIGIGDGTMTDEEIKIADLLIENGAEIREEHNGSIINASANGFLDIVDYILEREPDFCSVKMALIKSVGCLPSVKKIIRYLMGVDNFGNKRLHGKNLDSLLEEVMFAAIERKSMEVIVCLINEFGIQVTHKMTSDDPLIMDYLHDKRG